MADYFEDPIKLLRQLKGAPLAVLLAMVWTRARVSADFLVTVTGYTDKPVTQALKVLSAYGWITKVQGGWQITAGVQLPLMSPESEKFRSSSSSSDRRDNLNILDDEEESRKNSDSFVQNYRTLKVNGVREPALSRLSALEHVTPEFILQHIKRVRFEGGHLGTAIYRIEQNWQPVEVDDTPREHRRYTEGEFAYAFTDQSEG